MKITDSEQSLQDKAFMRRAISLASLGAGYTLPNPLVGAVLVYQNRIIGEGYHHKWGEPHAEVMAIKSVKPEDKAYLHQSTLYVTLEPCSHHGKTPPCADLIVHNNIRRVVVGQLDPFPEVSGRGIRRLQEAGIEVCTLCLEAEARALNPAFNIRYTLGRPFVALKWAESADGFIDSTRQLHEGIATIFSSAYRQRIVHRYRRDYHAILIGARTAIQDNPSLTNRYWQGRQPIRIILAPRLGLPAELKLLTDGKAETWILYLQEHNTQIPNTSPPPHLRYIALKEYNPQHILDTLALEGIQSIYIEGGSQTLQMFINNGLVDCIEYEKSPAILGSGVRAPK